MKKKLTEIGGHGRQGDVLLRRINEIPENKTKTKRATLAYGEATGHHHTFEAGAVGFADEEEGLANFVTVEHGTFLKHQEHSPIEFPMGNYEKLVQVEDTGSEIVQVAD